MIRISKVERKKLEKEYGLKFHKDMVGTYSRPRHYYLVERPYCLEALNKLRQGS